MKTKKVLHIIDSLRVGGAEKLLTEIVPYQSLLIGTVDVLLLDGEETFLKNRLKELNCCSVFSLGSNVYNPLIIFKIIPFLYKYDLVHVHLFPAQYFVAVARLFCFRKVKFVFTEHSTSNNRLISRFYRIIEKIICKFYDRIICITSEVKEVLVSKLNVLENKIVVINNGIDVDLINKCYAYNKVDFGFHEDDFILIMVGGFRIEKDQDTVVRALLELPKTFKLIFVGIGNRQLIIRDLVEELNLTEQVFFYDLRSDVYELIKMADISILSSHWEGFGLVAAESMACGVPVIATRVNGLAQVVQGGGVLFERGNAKELSEIVISLSNNPILRQEISINGIKKAKMYDIKIMLKNTFELYKSLLS